MLKKVAIGIGVVIVLVFVASILYSALQPKPFDWFPNYNKNSKQPYGTYIFHQQLPNLFPGLYVPRLADDALTPYYLNEFYDTDSLGEDGDYVAVADSTINLHYLEEDLPGFNLLVLNDYFHLTNLNAKALLLHLYQGNQALIVAEGSNELLLKMLGVKYEFIDLDSATDTEAGKRYTIRFGELPAVSFRRFNSFARITAFPDSARVLARNAYDDVVGLSLPLGKGRITLFTLPVLFTNYYLLKEDITVVENLVQELPVAPTYWASYIDSFDRQYNSKPSIMAYIHQEKALSWAFYTLITGVLVFLVLQLRRQERPVPVITAPENISLGFIESVSALFVLHKDNRELVRKKMNYFLDYVRNQHHLETGIIDERFITLLAKKLLVKPTLLSHIFNLYNELINKPEVSNDEFLRFNKLMQTFKHKT